MPESEFGDSARDPLLPRPAKGAASTRSSHRHQDQDDSNSESLLEELDDLRKENRVLRLAIDGAGLGLWDHDLVTHQVTRNDEWSRMLGYTPAEINARRDAWKELIHPDDRQRVDRMCYEHETGQTAVFRVRHRLRTKDGRYKWILNWGGIVERDADGKAVRATGIHIDISDQIRIEEELARVDKLESLGTLAAGMAHDFNNHLAVVLGNLSLVRSRLILDQGSDAALNDAEEAALRSQKVTGQLLAFAEGGAPLVEVLRVCAVVQSAVELAMLGSNVRCEVNIQPDVSTIEASHQQLEQALANLLMNAAQAMKQGGVVSVVVRNVRLNEGAYEPLPAGDYVEISVHDSGEGIETTRIGRVFDPFFTTREDRPGLGLSTSYRIVRNHGGHITADSVPGSGSTFTVYIPATDQPAEPAAQEPSSDVLSGAGSILVVDDQEPIRILAQRLLEELGYQCELAEDGAEAIEMYRASMAEGQPFDVVIVDLTIPGGMGGLEAAQGLLAADPEASVIVSSGYSNDPVLAQWEQHGFCERLPKPYRMAELSQTLDRVLERKRNQPPGSFDA